MIPAERLRRLLVTIIGGATGGDVPAEIVGGGLAGLTFQPDLDLEDAATLLRIWSGETDEIGPPAETPDPSKVWSDEWLRGFESKQPDIKAASATVWAAWATSAARARADVVIVDGELVRNRLGMGTWYLRQAVDSSDLGGR